jgi:signal transduction histidine kinase
MTDDERARIGHLPTGRGLLGHLIAHEVPLRVDDLRTHPASSGFPPGHPPMTSFLGLPVTVRGRVFGNLYLTDKTTGTAFTAEDERAVTALAGLAGFVIEHARLLMTTERRARWFEATALMPAEVLPAAGPDDALAVVLHRALQASDGATAMAVVPDDSGRFVVRGAVGDLTPPPEQTLREIHGALMLALASGTTRWVDLADGGAVMTRLALDPLARGALVIVLRRAGYAETLGEDPDLVAAFATHASLVLERHHTRAMQQQLAVLAERNRIARDLHDVVIQRLFALGLQLQAVDRRSTPETHDHLVSVMEDVDATITEIRRSIVALRPPDQRRDSLRSKVDELVTEYGHVLGSRPTLTISGPLDTVVDPALHHHVVAVLREALSNCARHASARHVRVSLTVAAERLTCTVDDDGVGPGRITARSGLANLAERAAELGGTVDIAPRVPRGTTLTWQVSLPPPVSRRDAGPPDGLSPAASSRAPRPGSATPGPAS